MTKVQFLFEYEKPSLVQYELH